jgi:hypothetical protein
MRAVIDRQITVYRRWVREDCEDTMANREFVCPHVSREERETNTLLYEQIRTAKANNDSGTMRRLALERLLRKVGYYDDYDYDHDLDGDDDDDDDGSGLQSVGTDVGDSTSAAG